MRATRVVRRIDKGLISPQATRNLATTIKIRPVVVGQPGNDRQIKSSSSRRYLTSTSRAGASTSTSHDNGPIGIEGEVATPEVDMSGLPTSTDLLEVYRGMVAQGRLAYDPEQVRIVMKVFLLSIYASEY
jgi:hypothetical protein